MLDTGDMITIPPSENHLPSLCVLQGTIINIHDCSTDIRCLHNLTTNENNYGLIFQSILCCPIQDNKGNIYGCLQVVNRSNGEQSFSQEEELQLVRIVVVLVFMSGVSVLYPLLMSIQLSHIFFFFEFVVVFFFLFFFSLLRNVLTVLSSSPTIQHTKV